MNINETINKNTIVELDYSKIKESEFIVKNNENINKLKSNSKENEIYISAKRLKFGKKFFYNFYLKRVKKLLEKGYKTISICGLGTLSELAMNLSNFCTMSIPKMEFYEKTFEDIEVVDFISKSDDKIKNAIDNLDLVDDILSLEPNNDKQCFYNNINNSYSTIQKKEIKRVVKLLKITLYKS